MMVNVENSSSTVTPHDYWTHCERQWANVRDGVHEAGNLPAEIFFEDLREAAEYVDNILTQG